jgi:S-adenosylmethionine decarboxylase proenzyme
LKALGKHVLLELFECDPKLLNDITFIKESMIAAANASGATILGESFHQFSPQGVSGVIIIAESHLTIHTWPEHGYAGADIFTCGTRVQPIVAAEVLIEKFKPGNSSIVQLDRGMIEIKKKAKG